MSELERVKVIVPAMAAGLVLPKSTPPPVEAHLPPPTSTPAVVEAPEDVAPPPRPRRAK